MSGPWDPLNLASAFTTLEHAVNENYLRSTAKIRAADERNGAAPGAKPRAIHGLQETAHRKLWRNGNGTHRGCGTLKHDSVIGIAPCASEVLIRVRPIETACDARKMSRHRMAMHRLGDGTSAHRLHDTTACSPLSASVDMRDDAKTYLRDVTATSDASSSRALPVSPPSR